MAAVSPPSDVFFLGANPDNPDEQMYVEQKARAVHAYVVGASGAGKSKMLLDWILQDVMAGRGCCVIDPKGDLVWDVLAAIASLDEGWWPSLASRVLLVDPSDARASVTVDPLEVRHGTSPARQRQEVFSIFRKIWGLDDARTPRMDLVLKRTLQLLIDAHLTLADIPRVLTDAAFRDRALDAAQDPGLTGFWRSEFPSSEAQRFQWVSGLLTRIEGFLDDPALRTMFGTSGGGVDFRAAMDRGQVVLVNLSKGRVGEESGHLLGGFVTAMLQLAAESRQNVWPPERRRRFHIYCDEFHGYMVASSLREMLAEARGYGVSLTIAHQNLSQLDGELRDSILANTRIRVCFRVNHQDAETLSRELFHVRGNRVKTKSLRFITLGKVPLPIGFDHTYYSHAEEGRQNRDALHRLPDRFFWVHLSDTNESIRLRTVHVPPFDRAVAEERVARFKALLQRVAPPSIMTASRPLPRLSDPRRPGLYEWAPPRPPRRGGP